MRYILFSLLVSISAIAEQCTFTPPPGWEETSLENVSKYIRKVFIAKQHSGFTPSMNLATEEVDTSLKEYVKSVKEIQTENPTTQWRDLGKFKMKAGIGRLVEITNQTAFGEVKIFQAFFVSNKTAYIITAALTRKDLPQYQAELLKSFQSLMIE